MRLRLNPSSSRIHFDKTLKALCFSGRILQAVDLLSSSSSSADPQTYALLLQECIHRNSSMPGRRIHAHIITSSFFPPPPPEQEEEEGEGEGDPFLYLNTKLLIFYAKVCGHLDNARHLFDVVLQRRSLVSWNAIISGYVHHQRYQEALDLYHAMLSAGFLPDRYTFSSVFRACARLAQLEQGKRAHALLLKTIPNANVVVTSALVDMYFKCSSPCDGRLVFDSCHGSERNVVTWTALISGYGQHGRVVEVLHLFDRMVQRGFRPNSVTFLAVLSACSHGGLLDAGWNYFYSMINVYGIKPKGEHYAAIVDMLGRAGRLDEAYEFVRRVPREGEHPVIWGALLGACRTHKDGELAKLAADKFFEMRPGNVGKYVVLANTYAALEMWEKVADVRQKVGMLGMVKQPAWSSVVVRGEVHTFFVGDKSHNKSEMIYETVYALSCASVEADNHLNVAK